MAQAPVAVVEELAPVQAEEVAEEPPAHLRGQRYHLPPGGLVLPPPVLPASAD